VAYTAATVSIRRAAVLLLAWLLLSGGSAPAIHAQSDRLPQADSLAIWYALGLNAHKLCGGLWVTGRDRQRAAETVLDEDVRRFPAFRWMEEFEYRVDESNRKAFIAHPGVGERAARYVGEQGCVILPAGADDVFFQPTRVSPALPAAAAQPWPTGDAGAEASFPEVDPTALSAALEWAFDDASQRTAQNTRGVVVVYRGRIIGERYAPGWGPYTPQLSWSMGKSVAAALTGVLVARGDLALQEPAPVPYWRSARDPRRDITVADLLRMSSGLDFDNFGLDPRRSYTADNEHFRIYFDALDVAAHAVHQPPRHPPGTRWRYLNSDPLTLMYLARRAVEARGEDFLSFPQRQLFDRIGIRSMVLETDAWGTFIITGHDWGGSRDWARFGLLHLWDGVWDGERILPEGWIDFISTPAPGDSSQGYGGQFWLNRGGAMRRLPADAYWAAGYMGQYTMIIPSRDLVVVRQGPSPGGSAGHFEELVARVLAAIGER
jgi:CubicO group peptidase (beta-lactamase class C family)